jgi:hypothetical protein
VVKPLDDGGNQAAADLCRQHMVEDVRELVAVATAMEAREDAGGTPDDLSLRRLRDARERLLEAAHLGMAHGLSRLEVQSTIAAAGRCEARTEAVRLTLYELIEEIAPD